MHSYSVRHITGNVKGRGVLHAKRVTHDKDWQEGINTARKRYQVNTRRVGMCHISLHLSSYGGGASTTRILNTEFSLGSIGSEVRFSFSSTDDLDTGPPESSLMNDMTPASTSKLIVSVDKRCWEDHIPGHRIAEPTLTRVRPEPATPCSQRYLVTIIYTESKWSDTHRQNLHGVTSSSVSGQHLSKILESRLLARSR